MTPKKIVRRGTVLEVLKQVVQEEKADLLVLGHEERTFFEKALFKGNVEDHVEELKTTDGRRGDGDQVASCKTHKDWLDISIPKEGGFPMSMTRTVVMLVDDEVPFVDTMTKRLSKRDLEIVTAYSGQEALEKLEGRKVDVVILDVKMPGMDGIETLRENQEGPSPGGSDHAHRPCNR